uniref:Exoribonuclease phosphorolytic domain-containing protein n=1 Tax=Meloidogyne incognita TaxID=6306 RepID=A0A914L3W7_MELIC
MLSVNVRPQKIFLSAKIFLPQKIFFRPQKFFLSVNPHFYHFLPINLPRYVFDIKCEIKILDYDGGLWDASVLAVSCAITHFKRSDVSYNSMTKKLIVHSNDKPPIPLTVYYKPVTTTFGFINGIEDPIIDPTMEESLLVDGFLIIGANHRDEICLISQSGNLNANQKSIEKCCEIALQNVKELIGYINTIKIK